MAINLLKLKIENIAKKLLRQNQLSNTNEYLKSNINHNQLSSDESTIKDSLSEFEDISKTLNPQNSRNLQNKIDYISKNSNQSIPNANQHHSSLCTKMSSLSHTTGGSLDYNKNIEGNKLNNKLKNKDINKSNGLLIKNEIENKMNLVLINTIHEIYQKLIDLFNFNKNYNTQNNLNLNEQIIKVNNEIMLLSYQYIHLVFSNDMEALIKLFNENEEIQKYFLLQIYFFISLIYLFEENITSNNYLIISYKSILYYSLINLEKIMNIINLPYLIQNEKLIKNIKSVNKIILSILKIINPQIPCNSQIIYFISPNNSIKNTIDNNMNFSGVLKLISLLKGNTKLKQKLIEIEKKNAKFMKEPEINKNFDKNRNKISSEEKKTVENIIKNKKANKNINKKNLIKPILPKMDITKYKYTLAIELDETLVHYCEDNDNYYAKVRFGSENFLQNISNFFEIIVVSTSGKEYSNIIIDNINKDKCYVEHRLYSEDFNEKLNLSNLNRDYKKLIFVCHEKNFLNAPKENILLLKEFNGEEEDREIIKLHNELNIIISENDEIKDIREFIPKIMEKIKNKNYEDFLGVDSQNEEE